MTMSYLRQLRERCSKDFAAAHTSLHTLPDGLGSGPKITLLDIAVRTSPDFSRPVCKYWAPDRSQCKICVDWTGLVGTWTTGNTGYHPTPSSKSTSSPQKLSRRVVDTCKMIFGMLTRSWRLRQGIPYWYVRYYILQSYGLTSTQSWLDAHLHVTEPVRSSVIGHGLSSHHGSKLPSPLSQAPLGPPRCQTRHCGNHPPIQTLIAATGVKMKMLALISAMGIKMTMLATLWAVGMKA